MIMRKDILIRAAATWRRHAGSLSRGVRGRITEGLLNITPFGSLMAKAALHFNREIKSSHKPKLSGLYYPLPQLVSKYVENCNLKSLIENEALH